MPNKTQEYLNLAQQTAKELTRYEQLADNKQYHELLQKKIASQDALRSLISEEAWKRYLDLDAVGNELESFRLETMYLAGAADYEKLFK